MMDDEPRIAIAASPREWAQALHRHVADHGGARVRATVLHQQDAIAEEHDVFVGDDSTSFLTRRLVEELHRAGRSVLGVYDPEDPRGKGELVDMGVDEVIARDAGAPAFVAAITALHARNRRSAHAELAELVRELDLRHTAGSGTAGSGTVGTARQPEHTRSAATGTVPPPPQALPALRPGRITAVGAAGGGAGATEIAIGLAHALGRRGDSTVLVDGDDVAPAVAQRLALRVYPNVRAAIDAHEHRTARLADVLTPVPGARFSVLPGLSNPRSWSELQPLATVAVLRALAQLRRQVVVNVGPRLEDLHGAGGPARYGVTRAVLGATDTAVVVAAPTPVGMARLLEWLADLRPLTTTAPVHVVFARSPSSAFKQGELAAELARSVQPAGVHFVPIDARVETAAWNGTLPSSGPFTRALAGVATAIAPPVGATPRRSRRRRVA
jgi:MinD-like ATPase involved in chromosome partitioning or flagellar assembly